MTYKNYNPRKKGTRHYVNFRTPHWFKIASTQMKKIKNRICRARFFEQLQKRQKGRTK